MAENGTRTASGLRFVLTAGILSVAFFGILRIPQIESHVLTPFTQAQYSLACRIGANPDAPISVGLSCSAADVIALCLGFILAVPVSWRRRLGGAALGLVLIAAVNTVRIATLSHAVGSRQWFNLLHVYIWPGILLLVVSLYVFLWMNRSLRVATATGGDSQARTGGFSLPARGVRFLFLTALFVVLFIGSSTWWMHSGAVLAVARAVAAAAAFIIRMFGGEAVVNENFLRTSSGSWIVTRECIMTPLIPAYFSAVFSLVLSRRQRILALLAAFPIFFMLGAARLLVLAIPPPFVGSHFIAIHGFNQFLLAAILIGISVWWSEKTPRDARVVWRRGMTALILGSLVTLFSGFTYNRMLIDGVASFHRLVGHPGHSYLDPQGALTSMAPYQLGLLVGLWLAWRPHGSVVRLLVASGLLIVQQAFVLFAVGEWVANTGLAPHVAATRAYAVVLVLAVSAWMLSPKKLESSIDKPLQPAEASLS